MGQIQLEKLKSRISKSDHASIKEKCQLGMKALSPVYGRTGTNDKANGYHHRTNKENRLTEDDTPASEESQRPSLDR
jgi:hypothetical protein